MVKVIKTERRVLKSMPSFFKDRKQKKKRQKDDKNQATDCPIERIQVSLPDNLNKIKQKTGNSSDVVIREIKMGGGFRYKNSDCLCRRNCRQPINSRVFTAINNEG
jgi:hypothetical protein